MLAVLACSLALPAAEGLSSATRSTLAGDCLGKCVVTTWLLTRMASCLALMPAAVQLARLEQAEPSRMMRQLGKR